MDREGLLKIDSERHKLEEEILDITNALNVPNMPGNRCRSIIIGVSGRLTDEEGFPIPNVDLLYVRTMRNRLIMLKNDHKSLMNKLEEGLHAYHKEHAPSKSSNSSLPVHNLQELNQPLHTPHTLITQTQKEVNNKPFCWVHKVQENSPAHEGGILYHIYIYIYLLGLEVGDAICSFGWINHLPAAGLSDIAALVEQNLAKPIQIGISRQSNYLELTLTPHPWDGPGTLGYIYIYIYYIILDVLLSQQHHKFP